MLQTKTYKKSPQKPTQKPTQLTQEPTKKYRKLPLQLWNTYAWEAEVKLLLDVSCSCQRKQRQNDKVDQVCSYSIES